jgi:hypothetical protein
MHAAEWVVVVFAALLAVASVASCRDCEARGGISVRGAFWWECVDAKAPAAKGQ